MAHYQQHQFVLFVKALFQDAFVNKRVLEIGSWDKNGTVRNCFEQCEYVGVDIAAGPGVDLVAEGQNVDLKTESFDTVISAECFEHNPHWLETFVNMWRMLKPGGPMIITCATMGRKEHGTSRTTPADSLTSEHNLPDYYRNLTHRDFERKLDLDLTFTKHEFFYNIFSKDLYFLGIKQGAKLSPDELNNRFAELRARLKTMTTKDGVSTFKKWERNVSWNIKKLYIPLIGEKAYQNLRSKKKE